MDYRNQNEFWDFYNHELKQSGDPNGIKTQVYRKQIGEMIVETQRETFPGPLDLFRIDVCLDGEHFVTIHQHTETLTWQQAFPILHSLEVLGMMLDREEDHEHLSEKVRMCWEYNNRADFASYYTREHPAQTQESSKLNDREITMLELAGKFPEGWHIFNDMPEFISTAKTLIEKGLLTSRVDPYSSADEGFDGNIYTITKLGRKVLLEISDILLERVFESSNIQKEGR